MKLQVVIKIYIYKHLEKGTSTLVLCLFGRCFCSYSESSAMRNNCIISIISSISDICTALLVFVLHLTPANADCCCHQIDLSLTTNGNWSQNNRSQVEAGMNLYIHCYFYPLQEPQLKSVVLWSVVWAREMSIIVLKEFGINDNALEH